MRLSFDLGLHVESTPYVEQGLLTVKEAEARRSTFWSCLVVNRYVSNHSLNFSPDFVSLLSFSLGRPFRADSEEVTVKKPGQASDSTCETWIAYPTASANSLVDTSPQRTGDPLNLVAEQWVSLCEALAPLIRVL